MQPFFCIFLDGITIYFDSTEPVLDCISLSLYTVSCFGGVMKLCLAILSSVIACELVDRNRRFGTEPLTYFVF